MKILVVDDEAMIREVIKEYCAANHFTTDEAASGKAWMGIRMIPLNGSAGWSGYSLGGYIYLDLPR